MSYFGRIILVSARLLGAVIRDSRVHCNIAKSRSATFFFSTFQTALHCTHDCLSFCTLSHARPLPIYLSTYLKISIYFLSVAAHENDSE